MKIIIFTCDKYAHCIPVFYHYWKKNWPDCPYPLLIVAGEQKIELPDDSRVSIVYQGPDRGYASNAKQFLSGFPDELCLLMLDDFIINKADTPMVLRAEELCKRTDVGCVRLIPLPGPDLPFADEEGFGEIDKTTATYILSLQVAIWKTKLFVELLREGEDPWQTELDGNDRAKVRPERFLCSQKAILEYSNYCGRGDNNLERTKEIQDRWGDSSMEGTSPE